MPLYLLTRPSGAPNLGTTAGLHGALVDAASAPAAIAAANGLTASGAAGAPKMDAPFTGYTATQVAATAQAGFIPVLVQGNVPGSTYSDPSRGGMTMPEDMTPEERDDWRLDRMGAAIALALRLAAAALLAWTREAGGDGYPRRPDVIRFARFYGVTPAALGGLLGLPPLRIDSKTTIWADQVHAPQNQERLARERCPRETMRGHGMFCAAASKAARENVPCIH